MMACSTNSRTQSSTESLRSATTSPWSASTRLRSLRDFGERCAFLARHQFQDLLGLAAGSGGLCLGVFRRLLRFRRLRRLPFGFRLFRGPLFLSSFRSSLFSFVLSASDDTLITPVRTEGEAKDR